VVFVAELQAAGIAWLREAEQMRRDDETQAAPPIRIDLTSGTAVIRRRPRAEDVR
jgi:hypothetical protein